MIVEDDKDDGDRWTFMKTFGEAAEKFNVRVYACCLMGTHYHTLLDTPHGNLSSFVGSLNSDYSKAFNRRHGRVGHTFEQRFNSTVVQREKYLRIVVRYIAVNPKKAGLCGDAAEWPWSTHRATAGLEDAPPWLHLDWLRWAFRARTLADAQRRYIEYVQDPSGLTWSCDLKTAVGTPRFLRAIGRFLDASGHDEWLPLECRRAAQPSLQQLFSNVEADIRSRDALIAVSHVRHGYRLSEIARFLGLEPSTVSKALRRAREGREKAGDVGCGAPGAGSGTEHS
jgi:REP element-mobilizing transposase RayT